MNYKNLKPKKALNKAFLEVKLNQKPNESSRTNLIRLTELKREVKLTNLDNLTEEEIKIVEGA